jgi:hypothetical protein
MCPACMTSIALIAAGGSSAGGLAMFAMTKLRAKTSASRSPRNTDLKGIHPAAQPVTKLKR